MQVKQCINDIAIDFQFCRNFANMEDIRRKFNSMVNLSQFTSNRKKLSGVIVLVYVEGHLWKAQWKEKPNDEGHKKLTMNS